MRRFVVDRRAIRDVEAIDLPGQPGALSSNDLTALLDHLDVPDGMPFLIDDGGTLDKCWSLNHYLLEGVRQGGLSLRETARIHSYALARLLRFIRLRHAALAAAETEVSVETWIAERGLPALDLIETTRKDLVAYKAARIQKVQPATWNNELSSISGFFDFALRNGWIHASPMPRWGTKRRNTLALRDKPVQQPKFLTETQLRHFLERGLRCDGDASPDRDRERNYAFGVLLATTGSRREEAGRLLDCEIPTGPIAYSDGIASFVRVGKGGVPRRIFITQELADTIDFYRRVERTPRIAAAQQTLRRMNAEGRLICFQAVEFAPDGSAILIRNKDDKFPAERLSDKERAVAVTINGRGEIEPLALFVSRYGLSPRLEQWDTIFDTARARVEALGQAERPPRHVKVTPHTMRHTYAVRMLAALMRVGRDSSGDPYALLANPVLTVTQLLGHADVSTTQHYLYAAERYTEELPTALRAVAANTVGHQLHEDGEHAPT